MFLEEVADPEGDPLKPLRSVLYRVGELAQLVEGFELKPSKTELRGISKEMTSFKARVHSLAKTLITSDDPAVATVAHELLGEANKVMTRGQKRVCRQVSAANFSRV
jgi:hypothetical protein